MTKISLADVKTYQRELRRQGFHLEWKDRSKQNGNEWQYTKWYETPNRLGTKIEHRKVDVQVSDYGCRTSHMLFTDDARRRGSGTTTPTSFTTVGEMILAIALEVSRYDQHRYGVEHTDKNARTIRQIIDDNHIVRVTTPLLGHQLTGKTGTFIADDHKLLDGPLVPLQQDKRSLIEDIAAIAGSSNHPVITTPLSTPNSPQSFTRCPRQAGRCFCRSEADCELSQRRQNFINGT